MNHFAANLHDILAGLHINLHCGLELFIETNRGRHMEHDIYLSIDNISTENTQILIAATIFNMSKKKKTDKNQHYSHYLQAIPYFVLTGPVQLAYNHQKFLELYDEISVLFVSLYRKSVIFNGNNHK